MTKGLDALTPRPFSPLNAISELQMVDKSVTVDSLVGKRFGKLVVVREIREPHKKARVYVACDCGSTKTISMCNVKRGLTKSCGCLFETGEVQVGKRFGKLTVENRVRAGVYECICDCGGRVQAIQSNLIKGLTKTCGCSKDRSDMTGKRFGMLVVIRVIREHLKRTMCECTCDCGVVKVIDQGSIRDGRSRSCGCRYGEQHRKSKSAEYRTYASAKQRCNCPSVESYPLYGGRGIEFRFETFSEFYEHLGPKPTPEHSIDRFPNPNGHYEKGNVRWATNTEQSRNRRNNISGEIDGVYFNTVTEACEAYGIVSDKRARTRIKREGWCFACAVTIPVKAAVCAHISDNHDLLSNQSNGKT
jgi:hypothetical protein